MRWLQDRWPLWRRRGTNTQPPWPEPWVPAPLTGGVGAAGSGDRPDEWPGRAGGVIPLLCDALMSQQRLRDSPHLCSRSCRGPGAPAGGWRTESRWEKPERCGCSGAGWCGCPCSLPLHTGKPAGASTAALNTISPLISDVSCKLQTGL